MRSQRAHRGGATCKAQGKETREMTLVEIAAVCTIASGGTTVMFLILGKVYGFGASSKAQELRTHEILRQYNEDMTKLITDKLEDVVTKTGDTLRSINERMHLQEKALLTFQLDAEKRFALRDSYAAIVADVKTDINERIDDLKNDMGARLGRVEDLVLNVRNSA